MIWTDLVLPLLVWVISFVAAVSLYYFLTVNYPQYALMNTIIVAIFGIILAYALGYYLLGTGLIAIPIIF